jgi:hypothetical protein
MNVNFLIDFKDLVIRVGETEFNVRLDSGEELKLGTYKHRKFLKIDNQTIEIEHIQEVAGTLVIKVAEDKYYVLRTKVNNFENEEYVISMLSNAILMKERWDEQIQSNNISANLKKCSGSYAKQVNTTIQNFNNNEAPQDDMKLVNMIALAIGKLPDSEVLEMIEWDKMIVDETVDLRGQVAQGIEVNGKRYYVDLKMNK